MATIQSLSTDPVFPVGLGWALICCIASITMATAQRPDIKLAFTFSIIGALALSTQTWGSNTAEKEEYRSCLFSQELLESIKNEVSEMLGYSKCNFNPSKNVSGKRMIALIPLSSGLLTIRCT